MWPFKKLEKTYLLNKSLNEVFNKLKAITDETFKERSSIRGKLLNDQPIRFEFYAPAFAYTQPLQIKPFRTDILVTIIEENGNTRINAIVKSNLTFPVIFFVLIAHLIIYMWLKDTWFNIQTWLIYTLGLSMMYFGDRISKSTLISTFEHYLKKAQSL